ncbi:MAG TPA: alpha/beta hydrolase [Candidatus Eisenbacteria bacterium]
MSLRVRFAILAALGLVLVILRGPAPPRPSASGVFGRGPTIVLVHGLGSSAAHWLPVARELGRDHRIVLIDLPGHGASEMPQHLTLERAAQALDLALASEAPVPSVLVGHSVGGLVAALEALDHPERVRGLVLVETALKPQIVGAERDTLLAALDHDYDALMRSVYLSFGRDSAQGMALYDEVARLDPAMMKAWVRLAVTTDLSARGRAFTVPMLVILSARSWPDDESWSTAAAALGYTDVPRLEHARIEDSGHFVMLDHPPEVARLIEDFAAHPESQLIAW